MTEASSTRLASMTPSMSRWSLLAVAALVSLTLGCTLRLVYNYADWVALWHIDRHFDLTRPQKRFLGAQLAVILDRHRVEALPRYERFLAELRDKVRDGLTEEEVQWAFETYVELRTHLFELLVKDGAAFLSSVDGRQRRHLARRFERDHEELAERLREDQEIRLAKRASATVEWLEEWLGPLSRPQEEHVRRLSLGLPDTLAAWLEYRHHRQRAFLALLHRAHRRETPMPPLLREWLIYPEKHAPVAYLSARERMLEGVSGMALEIDRLMTPRQRRHVLGALEEVIHDLHELRDPS